MRWSNSEVARGLLLCVALACLLFAGSVVAEEPTKVAGTMTAETAQIDSAAVADTDGHNLSLQIYTGTNASTGEADFMSGATSRNVSFSDLVMGTGTHRGYVEFDKDGSKTFSSFEGKITTVVGADGKADTSFKGTFTFTGGTGQFVGITGGGTYKGQFNDAGQLVADWWGEYTLGN